jgi:DNA-binding transcriptional MerR regulator
LAKSAEAFRTISEAAEELGVAQHVLRFWETKFPFVKPMKRAGGRRFYRPTDIAVLATVRRLLHQDGYTIKGVQKLYRETGLKSEAVAPPSPGPAAGAGALLADLERAKARLDAVLGRR